MGIPCEQAPRISNLEVAQAVTAAEMKHVRGELSRVATTLEKFTEESALYRKEMAEKFEQLRQELVQNNANTKAGKLFFGLVERTLLIGAAIAGTKLFT